MATYNKFYNDFKKKVSVFTHIREKESLRLSSRSQSDGFPVTNTQNSKQFNKMFKSSKVQKFLLESTQKKKSLSLNPTTLG